MINTRINRLSSNKQIFEEEKGHYEKALQASDFKFKMYHKEPAENSMKKKSRKRKAIWFNPPWADNVRIPIGHLFLKAIDRFFPKGHPLNKYYNRHTLKVSYSTTKNLKAYVDSHNRRILFPSKDEKPRCSCRPSMKKDCPMPGQCKTKNAIYQSKVASPGLPNKFYRGQAMDFKDRYNSHKGAIQKENSPQATALSNYIWKLKQEDRQYSLSWVLGILGRAPPYRSGLGWLEITPTVR